MVVVATKSFSKDISKIRDKKLIGKIENAIRNIEKVRTIMEISGIKKMEGSTNAYRVRIGDYRLGFYLLNETVQLTVFANRRDIYKLFP